jgi:hypothetical protein
VSIKIFAESGAKLLLHFSKTFPTGGGRKMNRKLLLGIAACMFVALLILPADAKHAELCPDRNPVKADGTCDFPWYVPPEARCQ